MKGSRSLIVISACLCGVNCKYNGKNNLDEKALKLFKEGKAILLCPEELGGMETPRIPHEIKCGTGADVLDGKAIVVSSNGEESTEKFIRGAKEALKIAKEAEVKHAILKAKSPSCGHGKIYDGSFNGIKREGNGVTAELFIRNGINVITEEELDENLEKSY
jgi:uncharacterized protein YbbK (DUF523 family)